MAAINGSGSAGTGKANGSGRLKPPEDSDPAAAGGWQQDIDGGYAPADFIIPGSDHQGHSERVYCRVQPQHARAMSKILNGHHFPFRTTGDLMRWCIVRGVKVLDKLEPLPGFIGAADAINEVLKQQLYMQEFISMFQTMGQVIQQHIANGAEGEARKMLTVVLGHVRKMEDEPYWKKKCEDEIKMRFGHLMEGNRGKSTSLRPGEKEKEEAK